MRARIGIICGLIFFVSVGFWLDNSGLFAPLKMSMRSKAVPTGLLRYSTLGKVLAMIGVTRAIANDQSMFKPTENTANDGIFQKKQQVGEYLFEINPGGMADFPSSQIIDREKFIGDWPIISIVTDDDNLYSPEKGIVVNYNGRGQKWERLAYVSYYENKKLLFATSAGLRLHGGTSRLPKTKAEKQNRLMLPENAREKSSSFRLYFRDDYGINNIPAGLVFGPDAKAIKTLVVHYEKMKSWPFRHCLSYDIVNQIGGVAPKAKPAILYLNGKYCGAYFICEHVSKRQWTCRFEHEDFAFHRYKGKSDEESEKIYRNMAGWAMDTRKRMTLEEAQKHIDVKNLSCFLFALAFCGNSDGFQGAAILETKKTDAKWFWVNWDMDGSWWYRKADNREVWEMALPAKNRSGLHPYIFSRLLTESPEYRSFFAKLVTDILNHKLNHEYLDSRLEYYDRLAKAIGIKEEKLLRGGHFFEHRADYVRSQMAEFPFFGVSDNYEFQLKGPDNAEYTIDGYHEHAGYKGAYFKGMPVTVKVEKPPKHKQFSHWQVNGKKIDDHDLAFRIFSGTTVRSVFK